MSVLKFIIQRAIPYRWYLFGIFAAMCLITIDNTLKPFLVKQLIDTVSGRQNTNLWLIAGFYGFLQIMLVSSWTLSDYCLTRYVAKFRLDVAEHFMKRLYDYPYSFFQNQLSGSLTSKLNDVFQHLPHLIFTLINPFCYFLILISISLVLLFFVAPVFAVILTLWVLLFFLITFFSLRQSIILNKEYSEEKANIIGLCADYLSNMLSVKTFTTKQYELGRFERLKKPFIAIAERGGFYHTWLYAILGLFTSIYAFGFIVFLILGYQKDSLSPGDFALVVMLNFNIINTVFELSHKLRDFVVDWGAVTQALAMLEEMPQKLDKKNAKNLVVNQGQIVFDKVKFNYHGGYSLFQNKSVVIEAGQRVGLVGYSGGGKSTFVNLILRLYDVVDGQILIDDQDIQSITQDSLRQAIAMIPQDPMLFHRSLMDNIRYGRTGASDEEIILASQKAHAHEFISKLPHGYDALVGERGVKLSGGQRQRIAIARAILKNAPILILDEATSQLDSITESNIQDSLWELMQGKTTLVVAHRLSTLLHMDRILVFDKGHIIEDGTHTELLMLGGLYKILWDAQVGGFLPDKNPSDQLN
ncbi:TPA: ABC transporter ATP-binding protein [Legionella pneumophila]|mgnify:CR=1 FL=1|uniref:ABC transporter ATP-binding protein n=2 Tax=Legionella TaxID=445 RepID=A0A378PG69_9GAMM|nr:MULTISPECIES: ABC transporter ATP-binding protein [Legionella]MCA0402210.1 ABC transporter ATP-binding protein/permease [Pseudomonadota bacterium]KTD70686.1 multidrug resistance ABC transporter ATP-binding protein [Legionella steigerwaltii]MBN9228978.1 ABC transporter ATP-binding protein [Legionella steelei]MCL9684087.1 ABC transporter ATP-binding protein/permease [Legionella maioricensis]MCL9687006.1 ABC transporter ATP-binding protein/permease [Legionella maioricensis]